MKNTKPIIFETFKNISDYYILQMKKDHPDCFNSKVQIKKYKVTIEEIKEPDDIYIERLKTLYKISDNWHNRNAIQRFAKKHFNIDLI